MPRSALASAAAAAALVGAGALPSLASADAGQVLVAFEESATLAQMAEAKVASGATSIVDTGRDEDDPVVLEVGDRAAVAQELEALPGVRYVEAVATTHAAELPESSGLATQWALDNSGVDGGLVNADTDMIAAWGLVGSGAPVVVGVVDTGVNFDHPALADAHFARNPGETGTDVQGGDKGTNRVDDDLDGCIDDVWGCDLLDGDGDARDGNGHGTAAAGVIFAGWHVSRYAGIAPKATIYTAKVLDDQSRGTTAALAAGLNGIAAAGAKIVNVSVVGPESRAVREAIASHPQTLFVVAAGNDGRDLDTGAAVSFPCEEPLPNVLCVGASTRRDGLAAFSNYGAASVDALAPGDGIATLTLTGTSSGWSGTSFATPQASGIAALAFAAKPDATVAEVKRAMLDAVDPVDAAKGRTVTGGRLNAYRTILTLQRKSLPAHRLLAEANAITEGNAIPEGPAPATMDVSADSAPAHTAIAAAMAGRDKRATATPASGAKAPHATGRLAGRSATTVPQIGQLTFSAARKGAKAAAVTARCWGTDSCTAELLVTVPGAPKRTEHVVLAAGQRKTVTVKVKRAKDVGRLTVAVGGAKRAVDVGPRSVSRRSPTSSAAAARSRAR